LNQEKTTTNYNAPSVGSLLAVPFGSDAPAGYSLYQRGTPKELVWEEKAPVSVARNAYDGVEVLDGKIYFVGGHNGSAKNIAERYDPTTDTWETLSPMSVARLAVASTVLNGKVYAIGGQDKASVEVYDPAIESWSEGVALPGEVNYGSAITLNEKIYLIGGRNASDQNINQVLCYDPSSNQWNAKANMPTARHGMRLVWFENRIWAIGGYDVDFSNKVESYDPTLDSWQVETPLHTGKNWPSTWIANGILYVAGGRTASTYSVNSIVAYNPIIKLWTSAGNLPENKYVAGTVVLNDKVYIIAGLTAPGVYSNKVSAADLNASMEGVYDLYRKDGDAPVGTPVVQSEYADGSVTGSKMADGAVTASKIASKTIGKDQISDSILKYLKPEISAQPQIHGVYAGTNTSIPVIAEGKYLTYQWKKDGVDLTDETNATLIITDANATLHDGNYSVVVSNDFGSVESNKVEVQISDALLNGLVGWWKFDEGSGTVAYDSSGNGNDGSLINGPTWTTGKIGGALSFDGVDDLLLLPHSTLAERNLFSYCLWFYATETSSIQHTFLSAANSVRFNEFLFWTKSQQLEIQYKNNVIGITSSLNSEYWLNKWKYLTLIYNPNRLLIYSNGQEVFDINYSLQSLNIDSGGLILGADQDSFGGGFQSNQFVKGLIDDLRIYDRALSAEEVQALYNLGQ
jgi:N-acetylneuraminic acid mutarotase